MGRIAEWVRTAASSDNINFEFLEKECVQISSGNKVEITGHPGFDLYIHMYYVGNRVWNMYICKYSDNVSTATAYVHKYSDNISTAHMSSVLLRKTGST